MNNLVGASAVHPQRFFPSSFLSIPPSLYPHSTHNGVMAMGNIQTLWDYSGAYPGHLVHMILVAQYAWVEVFVASLLQAGLCLVLLVAYMVRPG